MEPRTGCKERDSAIQHAKDEFLKSEDSSLSKCHKELTKLDLISRFREVDGKFGDLREKAEQEDKDGIWDQFSIVTNEIINIANRYGIKKIAFYNIRDLLGKMDQRHIDLKDLHTCTCCNGSGIHPDPIREGKALVERGNDCKTCDSSGRIEF